MDPVGTRELSYFVAVAEELHFGRAARRLGMAQPPLSRAIKQLERRLGVRLLERSSRRVALTPAGEVLLCDGRKALDAVAAATRRTQRAGQPDRPLILAVKPGGDAGLLTDILAAYESQPGASAVDVAIGAAGEQTAMLRDGRADVGLLRTPHHDLTGFATQELLVEGQVVVLPQGHRLAERTSAYLDDLRGETMPRWPGVPTDGPDAPDVHDIGELMQHIALGHLVALVPESVRGHLRHDLVAVPVIDAPPTTVVVAWPEGGSPTPALSTFVRTATTVAARRRQPQHAATVSALLPGCSVVWLWHES